MNGLPEQADLSSLVGQQIDQIRFSKWSVQLLFSGPIRIVIESSVCLSGDTCLLRTEDYLTEATAICQLIGSTVTSAERTSGGGLALQMSSGVRIDIENSNTCYESFQVHLGDEVLVA
jgi:hypothetical protein